MNKPIEEYEIVASPNGFRYVIRWVRGEAIVLSSADAVDSLLGVRKVCVAEFTRPDAVYKLAEEFNPELAAEMKRVGVNNFLLKFFSYREGFFEAPVTPDHCTF